MKVATRLSSPKSCHEVPGIRCPDVNHPVGKCRTLPRLPVRHSCGNAGTLEEKWHPILGALVEQHAESLKTHLGRHFSSFVPPSRNDADRQGGFRRTHNSPGLKPWAVMYNR